MRFEPGLLSIDEAPFFRAIVSPHHYEKLTAKTQKNPAIKSAIRVL